MICRWCIPIVLLLLGPQLVLADAQISVDVRSAYVDDHDLLILEDGVENVLHESEWASFNEIENAYALWLSELAIRETDEARDVSVLVDLRSANGRGKGRLLDSRRVFFTYRWRRFREGWFDDGGLSIWSDHPDLVRVTQHNSEIAVKSISYFNGAPSQAADSVYAGVTVPTMVTVSRSFIAFHERVPTPIEFYERSVLSRVVVDAAEEMVKSQLRPSL